jgi:hypothetical protein
LVAAKPEISRNKCNNRIIEISAPEVLKVLMAGSRIKLEIN